MPTPSLFAQRPIAFRAINRCFTAAQPLRSVVLRPAVVIRVTQTPAACLYSDSEKSWA